MTDATQGDWQPLADQPIASDDALSAGVDDVVWASPPDAPVWGKPADTPVGTPPLPKRPTAAEVPVRQIAPTSYSGAPNYSATEPVMDGRNPDRVQSPPPHRSSLAGSVGLAVVAVLIVVGLAVAARGGNNSATSPGTLASEAAPPIAGPLDAYLLSPADIGPGTRMTLAPGGRSLSGESGATLDFCRNHFASEKARVQRVQAQYEGPTSAVSNEFVRYQPGGAQAAFTEIGKAVATCGSGYQNAAGVVSHINRPAGFTGLAAQHVVVGFQQQVSEQGQTHSFWVNCVYQFDGDNFSGLYVYSADQATGHELAAALAKRVAGHLKEAASGSPGSGGGILPSGDSGNDTPGLPT